MRMGGSVGWLDEGLVGWLVTAGMHWDGLGKDVLSPLRSFTKMEMLSASASWREELEWVEADDEDRDERMIMVARESCW